MNEFPETQKEEGAYKNTLTKIKQLFFSQANKNTAPLLKIICLYKDIQNNNILTELNTYTDLAPISDEKNIINNFTFSIRKYSTSCKYTNRLKRRYYEHKLKRI